MTITILSDPGFQILKLYDVWKEKKRCSKVSVNVIRNTYLIDDNKIIIRSTINKGCWRSVKYAGEKYNEDYTFFGKKDEVDTVYLKIIIFYSVQKLMDVVIFFGMSCL